MKLAIMQPYFFPYAGYYQLLRSVDEFVCLDDVAFIKRGYINRNAVLLDDAAHGFTIPVVKASQNRAINEHEYTGEFGPFLKLLERAYGRAPSFEPVFEMATRVCEHPDLNVARKNQLSLEAVRDYLGRGTVISRSSELGVAPNLKGQDRILEICRLKSARDYHNPPGGRELYDANAFSEREIQLYFVQPGVQQYPQRDAGFVPHLSILDLLMFNDIAEANRLLEDYSLAK